MLELKNISKYYRKIAALEGISLDLKKGEIFGYIGTNGAGKTTTIKIIVGLIKSFTGDYFFQEQRMPDNILNVHKLLGYLPQDVAFQEWRTVNQALFTFAKLSGLEDNQINKRIKETLEMLGITEYRFRKIKQLSGGTIQKVGLAQAIIHEPDFIVLDEPLNGLDPVSRQSVKAILKDLSERGKTVFFSSHILSDVEDIASRIGIINKGKILITGTKTELMEKLHKANRLEIKFSKNEMSKDIFNDFSDLNQVEEKNDSHYILHFQNTVDLDEITHSIIEKLIQSGSRIRSIAPVIPTLDEIYENYVKGAE